MLIVVEYSGYKISSFLSRKKELPEKACEVIRQLQQEGVKVQFVRMDNTGENLSFADLANGKEWTLKLTFELTGAMTPQRNYLAEVGFGTLWSRLRATLDAAMVPEEEKYKLVREGISHLTFLDGLIVKKIDGQTMTRYGHVFGKEQKLLMPLRIWGKAGFVKITGKMKSKLEMRGAEGMFVGYAGRSAPDTYRMYVPEHNSIHVTRDVQWQKKMYFAPAKVAPVQENDSVAMVVDKQVLPLRTSVKTATEANKQGRMNNQEKPKVKFQEAVDCFSAPKYESDDGDGLMLWPPGNPGPFARQETVYIVEVDPALEEEMSTISNSLEKQVRVRRRVRAQEEKSDETEQSGGEKMCVEEIEDVDEEVLAEEGEEEGGGDEAMVQGSEDSSKTSSGEEEVDSASSSDGRRVL
jgi:hypothetical protein